MIDVMMCDDTSLFHMIFLIQIFTMLFCYKHLFVTCEDLPGCNYKTFNAKIISSAEAALAGLREGDPGGLVAASNRPRLCASWIVKGEVLPLRRTPGQGCFGNDGR